MSIIGSGVIFRRSVPSWLVRYRKFCPSSVERNTRSPLGRKSGESWLVADANCARRRPVIRGRKPHPREAFLIFHGERDLLAVMRDAVKFHGGSGLDGGT